MIVIGYQGIGKSTLAKQDDHFIDLESSMFFINGHRDREWYKIYCNIAEDLSKQGYIVFVSSHAEVRERLTFSSEDVVIVYPSLELKEQWIAKLKDRYDKTGLLKDYKALIMALERYEENIIDMSNFAKNTIIRRVIINDIEYNLADMLIKLQKNNSVIDWYLK